MRMENDRVCRIVGIRDVCVETDVGCILLFKNVQHVPNMWLNLISTDALDDDGYHNHFGEGKWKLSKGSLVPAPGEKINSLYTTRVRLCNKVNAVECNSTDLWHLQLGYMSKKGLQILVRKNFVKSDGMALKTCTHCFAGKRHRVAFQRSVSSRKSKILDLVHTDLCSMSDRTFDGALYFVTFIDDFSRKLWAYALKSKDKVLEVFKQFHAGVEREIGQKLKCVRFENGGEYHGTFESYCKAHGIKLEKTVPKVS